MTKSFWHRWQAARNVLSGKRKFHLPVHGKARRSRFVVPPLKLHWIKRRAPSMLGWPGMIGIGLLSICPTFYFSAILPAREEFASTRNSVLALQEQMKRAGQGENAAQRTPEEQLAEFYRTFPDSSNLPANLEKIFALAQSQGIWLDKGEYKVTRSKQGDLVSFEAALPVKGDYLQLRKYLIALRKDIPILSLQNVQFKRQKVGDRVVEANIKLALYLLERKS